MAFLDETGLHVPNYEELLEQYQTNAKRIYGDDVAIDSNSVIGQKIKTEAWEHAAMYRLIEDMYYNNYIDQSEGNNLELLGSNFNVSRLPASHALVNVTFTGKAGTNIPESTIISTENDIEFETTDSAVVGLNGNVTVTAQSVNKTSAANVNANQINVLVDQITGIDAVNNSNPADGGADKENDLDYQERIHLSNESPSNPTKNGIISALLKVPGVQLADVDFNSDWKNANEQGDPPGSIHIYVQGGTNEDIAKAIFNVYGYGVPLAGEVEYPVTDIGGHKQVVRFSKAKSISIYAKITLAVNEDFDESTSISELQQNITEYIETVTMGDPIKYKKFIQLVLNIQGVDDCDIAIGTDSNSLSNNDIIMQKFTSGVVNNPATDIKVVVNNE